MAGSSNSSRRHRPSRRRIGSRRWRHKITEQDLSDRTSSSKGVHSNKEKAYCTQVLNDARKTIIDLRDKLAERHMVSEKIKQIDRRLQKIDNRSGEVIVEMENRLDDMNRDFNRRLSLQDAAWNERFEAIYERATGRPPIPRSDLDTAEQLRNIRHRLDDIYNLLQPMVRRESNADHLKKDSSALVSAPVSSSTELQTARAEHSSQSRLTQPRLYGVAELIEAYSTCLQNLERTLYSLTTIMTMPALIGNASSSGLVTTSEVSRVSKSIAHLAQKLKASLSKARFCGSPERPAWNR